MSKKLLLLSGAAIGVATLFGTTGSERAIANPAMTAAQGVVAESDFPQRPLWGDTHLHTSNSFDAFAAGARLGPQDALRFARGEQVTSSSGQVVKLSRALDFLVIADHSDALGVTVDLYNTPESDIADPRLRRWRNMMHENLAESFKATREIITAFRTGDIPPELVQPERIAAASRRIWNNQVSLVERYNEPGKFTALHGFEFTLDLDGDSLHRNVVFRDNADRTSQILPFPAAGTKGVEDLWSFMEGYERNTGGRALAIPHNTNLSNGLYFRLTGPSSEPMTANEARRRAAREPIVEVTQFKGDSESHPLLSRNDEFADFGDAGWDLGNASLSRLKQPAMLRGEYIREALKRGLAIQQRTGVNPYAFGLIGSTDSHTGLSTAAEDEFMGKMVSDEPGPDRMARIVNPGAQKTRQGWHYLAGGLAAVWAKSNTREAIFDAMQRREVYATTGTRMTVRFFAGSRFAQNIFKRDWVKLGYAQGVPMGGNFKAGRHSPSFIVQALKDPMGANLDRIQIVKGWVDARGETHEKVFDVVWSDPRRRKIVKGRVTSVGDTVDLTTATYTNTIGAPELRAVWRDPEWRAGQQAFYYVRALEIPTPRWTAFDVVRFGIKPPEGTTLTAQERAYTSPIWVGS